METEFDTGKKTECVRGREGQPTQSQVVRADAKSTPLRWTQSRHPVDEDSGNKQQEYSILARWQCLTDQVDHVLNNLTKISLCPTTCDLVLPDHKS